MSQSNLPCDLKLGYTPTVFEVGRQQSVVVFSRCKGKAEWEVDDTDDWKSDESKTPNRDGYYSYRLQAKWHHAVNNERGIRFHFRPLPVEESEPATITLEVIVEDSGYLRPSGKSTSLRKLSTQGLLAFVLWVATAVLGLWVIAVFVSGILPAIILAFGGQMSLSEQRQMLTISWNCSLIGLAIVWIAIVIAGGEYHRKRVGQPNSWKLFGMTLAAECLILLVGLFV